MLSLMMIVTYMPAIAFAGADDAADAETPAVTDVQSEDEAALPESVDPEEQTEEPEAGAKAQGEAVEKPDAENVDNAKEKDRTPVRLEAGAMERGTVSGLADSDELLMQFMQKRVSGTDAAAGKSLRKSRSAARGSNLPDLESAVYEMMASEIRMIASGERTDAQILIPLEEAAADGKTSYSAEDLGVTSIAEEEDEAVAALNSILYCDYDAVMNALLSDLPYDLYWFDKLEGYLSGANYHYVVEYSSDFDDYVLSCEADEAGQEPAYVFSLSVSKAYRGELVDTIDLGGGDTFDLYSVNAEKTSAASTAASNAGAIIDEYAEYSDLDKLYAYKDAVCESTSYNEDAAADDYEGGYGDPWQMIYVFDGDESTGVVCEGYSKAFQFLCDNTVFADDRIGCDSVTGHMTGGTGEGDHMWNILHMDDNRNYLADITNCDEDNIGYPDALFLKGYTSGAIETGYTYAGAVSYIYDEDTLAQYMESELEMSDSDYAGGTPEEIPEMSYTVADPLTELVDGWWTEEDGEFFYYRLYPSEGDVLTLDGIEYIFNSEEELFISEEDEIYVDSIGMYALTSQFDEHWVLGDGETEKEFPVRVTYYDAGISCDTTVTLKKNPVTGIRFVPVNEYADLLENVDGYAWEEDGWSGFFYDVPYFEEGDQLIVSYIDKEDVTYVYKERRDRFENIADSSDRINTYYDRGVTIRSSQSYSEQWTVTEGDSYYESTVKYLNLSAPGRKIRINPSPVESVSFSRNGKNKIELIKDKDIDRDYETDEFPFDYYRPYFVYGDRLTVNMADGTSAEYEYRRTQVDGYREDRFVNIEDETDILDNWGARSVELKNVSEQSYSNQWIVGGSYKAEVRYMGRAAEVDVTLIPNPVTKVEFELADGSGTMKLVENVDGFIDWEYDEDDNRIDYFYYAFPAFEEGDSLYVTKNGGTQKYVYRGDIPDGDYLRSGFVNTSNEQDVIFDDEVDYYRSNQPYYSPWVKGGEGYTFDCRYFGVSFSIPVEIIENPVASFKFLREGYGEDQPIELTEGIDAWLNSDGGSNRWFEYYLTFKNGDTIRVTDPQDDSSDYNAVPYSEDWDEAEYFENEEGKKIKAWNINQTSDQSFKNEWKPGDGTHDINLEYYTRNTNVKVVIRENPVKEMSFVRRGCDAVPLLENGDGYDDGWNFHYEIQFKAGDELYITYSGTNSPVKYVAEAGPDGKVYEFKAAGTVPEGAEESINAYDLSFRHNYDYQLTDLAEGETPTVMLMYKSKWVDVPVEIVSNPVENIEFEWKSGGDRKELVENLNGYEVYYSGEEDPGFRYELPFDEGDILKVKYAGTDTPVSYVYGTDDGWAAFSASGSVPAGAPAVISPSDVRVDSDQDYYTRWESGHDYGFEIEYMGSRITVPVTIVKGEAPAECDHAFVFVPEQPATCGASGLKEHYRCSECGRLFVKTGESYTETSSEELAVPATNNHTAGAAVREVEVAATCKSEGSYDEVVYCSTCGKELSRVKKAITKTAHKEVVIPAVAATCTEAGSTEGRKCTECGTVTVQPAAVPAKGHSWGSADYKWNADYTEVTGTRTCSVCGEKQTAVAKRAGSEVTKSPTLKEPGEILYTSEAFTAAGFEVQTVKAEIPQLPVEDAISQAENQAKDAENKTEAAEGVAGTSTDEKDVSAAEAAAAKAAELAAIAEDAAASALEKAQADHDRIMNDPAASDGQKEAAIANLENAKENVNVAKKLVAAAGSTVARTRKAAANIALNKADVAVAEAEEAAKAAEKAAKEAAEAQAAADEAAKTPGEAAVAAAEKAKEAAIASQKAAAAAKEAAEKAQAATELAKAAADIAKAASDKAVEIAEATGSEAAVEAAKKVQQAAETAAADAAASASEAKSVMKEVSDAEIKADTAVKEAEKSITNAEAAAADHVGTPEIKLSKTEFTYKYKVKTVKKKKKAVPTVQKPAVTVTLNGKTVSADNYDVTYSNAKSASIGAYKVTVTLKGQYSGSATESYTINPKAVELKKVTKGKKKFTAAWKKLSKNDIKYKVITGYQIRYATKADFSGAKTVKAGTLKSVKKTISKLKGKKKYYVQLRTYKTVSGRKFYSKWSRTKTVTTTK